MSKSDKYFKYKRKGVKNMKTVIKVFLYLGIILFGLCAGIMLIMSFIALPVSLGYLVSVCFCAIPITVDVIALKKLDNCSSKSELLGISICVLIFGGLIAGILMLCASEEDLCGYSKTVSKTPESATQESDKTEDLEKELTKLKKLKDNGDISEEEYETLRKKALDKYSNF